MYKGGLKNVEKRIYSKVKGTSYKNVTREILSHLSWFSPLKLSYYHGTSNYEMRAFEFWAR